MLSSADYRNPIQTQSIDVDQQFGTVIQETPHARRIGGILNDEEFLNESASCLTTARRATTFKKNLRFASSTKEIILPGNESNRGGPSFSQT